MRRNKPCHRKWSSQACGEPARIQADPVSDRTGSRARGRQYRSPAATPRAKIGVHAGNRSQSASATAAILEEKIRSRRARVGIVGLGYVGLPLAVEFAKAGFTVTGIDISEEKTRRVNAGDSYVGDIPSATLAPLVESGKLRATTRFLGRAGARHHQHLRAHAAAQDQRPGYELYRLRVPGNRQPLPSGDAGDSGIDHLPGTTDELVLPMLSKSGLEVGRDFFRASRRSAWTRAIRATRRSTFPRWWAG